MKTLANIIKAEVLEELEQDEVLNLENLITKYNVLNFDELEDNKFYARLDTTANGRDFYGDRLVVKGDIFYKDCFFVEVSENAYNKFQTSSSFRIGYVLSF